MPDLLSHTTLYVEVLLPLNLAQFYTYRVPFEWNEEVAVGKRVIVQFGRKKVYSALILSISEQPPEKYQAKYILSVMDDLPIVNDTQLRFWEWVAQYYMCTMGEVMNAALPSALKLESQSKVVLRDEIPEDIVLDKHEIPVIDNLRKLGELTMDQVDKLSGKKSTYKIVQSLYEKGLIWINEEIQGGYKAKVRKFLVLNESFKTEEEFEETISALERRAPKQLEALLAMMSADRDMEGVDRAEFISEHDLSTSAVNALIDKQIFIQYEKEVDRLEEVDDSELRVNQLTVPQKQIYEALHDSYKDKEIALLQGVTSSGKTHIYISLIEEQIKKGKQVLYLLPEISLTTQLIRRLQAYFGNSVVVTHSRFNNNERAEVWYKLLNKEIDILIAPRSGVFMPFDNLGLIVVDEEHENSYKQNEPNPRYNARDASIVLARMHGAKVLLGSATPSLESYRNALDGKYGFRHLEGRYSGVQVPEYEIVDMRLERRLNTNNGIFSGRLLDEIKQAHAEGKQSILFLNRKGYVPITECVECSWTPKCIRCDISLTYYRKDNCLRCHFCGYQIKPINECPSCGNTDIRMTGYGTERVETELQTILPDLAIQRFDQATARTKSAYERIIGDFEAGRTDILVGTQMLTKGLDFQNVTLVGILDADHALNFPDFRAYERSFQQMIQVGGRAGRREIQGKVLIQTNQPSHRALNQVVQTDYKGMYELEVEEREKFNYPPFWRLVRITVKHKDYFLTEKAADYLNWLLKKDFGDFILGPEEPFVTRIRGLYLRQLLIKLDPEKSRRAMKAVIALKVDQFRKTKEYRGVRLVVDVDPY